MSRVFRLSEEQAAFIQGGVTIFAAAADAGLRASLVLALGCSVIADRRRIRLYLAADRSEALLGDLDANGRIAVVFGHPPSHHTIQIKGRMRGRRPVRPRDRLRLAAYLDSFVEELRKVGEREIFVRNVMACRPGSLVAIEFEPEAAFVQTPGPRAGAPVPS